MSELPSNTTPNSQQQKNMPDEMSAIQAFYYGAFVQALACHEETDGQAYTGAFVARMGQRLKASTIPASVQAAHRYYYEHVEKQDWGGVGVYQVMLAETSTYAVHTTCDGDEQWLEIYGEDGAELGFAMIYVDAFEYTDKQTLRTSRLMV